MDKIFSAVANKGAICFDDEENARLLRWSLKDKKLFVTISTKKKKRSNNQNSYYHGVVIKILSDHTGYSAAEMHDALRLKFLLNRDSKIATLRSTTSLSTVAFEEYMSSVRQWASAELGVYVPEPNEVAMI